jgi:CubicO group peptidase (beta-lactamase class C family)
MIRPPKHVRRAPIVAGLILVALACGPPEREGLAGEIDAIVRSAMEEGPIAGVSVVVARGSRIVHQGGYGFADVENQIPVTPETVFKIGSITKQFTAAAVVALEQDGDLEFDDPLTVYLPEYPGYASETSIATLLSHTSGVKNYTTLDRWWETLQLEMPPLRVIEIFETEPYDFRPGTRFSYTNSGYILLGWIAETVSGQPFGGLLNERFFVPLQLGATSYCDDRALVPNRARGYQVLNGELAHADHVSMSQAYAAGGVCSNGLDLIRWSRLLSGGAVVGRDGYESMSSPASRLDGTAIEYGYGMAIGYLEGHHKVSHVGGMLGFAGQISHYDEDDVTIVVLTNTEAAKAANIESEIARLMLGLGDQEIRDLLLAPDELAAYEGTYDLSLTTVEVGSADGRLRAQVDVPGLRGTYVLLYQGDGLFVAASDSEITIDFPEGEESDRFVLTHKGITMHGERIAS